MGRDERFTAAPAALCLMVAATLSLGVPDAFATGARLGPDEEPDNAGWTLHLDNDRLSLAETDEGFTSGFTLVFSGRGVREHPLSLDRYLGRINRWLGVEPLYADEDAFRSHSLGFGMAAFTPKDIGDSDPLPDQRPYACLTFLASSERAVVPARDVAYQTTLVFGLLGTGVCEGVQDFLHDVTNSVKVRGWEHQISDGGEPTLLWRVGRQQPLREKGRGRTGYEITGSLDAQLGYVTDVGAGISWRWGRIRTPWWGFTPQHAEYTPFGTPIAQRPARRAGGDREFYLWAGGMVRYRLYNAILQGQFRDSDVEVSSDDLKPLLAELWIGATREFRDGLEITLAIRARSREFEGAGGEELAWGGLVIRRVF